MNQKKCFFFCTSANRHIGTGHLMRCKFLAQTLLQYGSKVHFILFETDIQYHEELQKENITYEMLVSKNQLIGQILKHTCHKRMVIFDTDKEEMYDPDFQQNIIEAGIKLMHITFYDHFQFKSHIVHNQNLLSLQAVYDTADYTRKLLGLHYAILSFQYDSITPIPPTTGLPQKVFITFGGSDAPNRTQLLLEILQESGIRFEKVTVVLGLLYAHMPSLEKFIRNSSLPIRLYRNTDQMSVLMQQADFGFSSGGFTAWELALCRVPTAIISHSQREELTATYLDEQAYCFHIGNISKLSRVEIKQTVLRVLHDEHKYDRAAKFHAQIDTKGRERVVKEMLNVMDHE